MRLARKKAASSWGPQSSQQNGWPIRLPRACSIAAKPLLHQAAVPAISLGPALTATTLRTAHRLGAAPPRSSGGTSKLDEGQANQTKKPEAIKSGEAKNRPTQSPPAPPRAGRQTTRTWTSTNLMMRHPVRLRRSAPSHGSSGAARGSEVRAEPGVQLCRYQPVSG